MCVDVAGFFLRGRPCLLVRMWSWCYIDDGGASRVPFPAYVLKRCQGLDEAQLAVALHETTVFGPVSSRNIVFARVVLVKISSNRVSTRRLSTHLWRFSTCKIFILALVFPDDDIARNFKPNTLNVRWTLTRQCDMPFLLNCSGPFTRSAVTVEGDRADRDLGSLLFFVAVHCSLAKDDGFQWPDASEIFFLQSSY